MPTSPTVSVVVPNYNHAVYLEQRLKSILEQSYQDFELIYLDDGSTDDSSSVFAKFATEPRVRSYTNECNAGNTFGQWNRGVKLSRGRYVWIAESDDAAEPELLEGLVGVLERHPKVGLAYCQSWRVDPNGARRRSGRRYTNDIDRKRWRSDYYNSGRDECERFLALKNTIPNASAVVFRKDVFQAAGGAPEDLLFTGDWMTWIRMLMRSDVYYVSSKWNLFRQHPQTVRRRAVIEGIGAGERYRILDFILTHVRPSPQTIDRALGRAAENWVDSATMRGNRVSMTSHRRIHEVASRLDPRLGRRLLRALPPSRWPSYVRFLAQIRALDAEASRRETNLSGATKVSQP